MVKQNLPTAKAVLVYLGPLQEIVFLLAALDAGLNTEHLVQQSDTQ
jgi:hypothetical protein